MHLRIERKTTRINYFLHRRHPIFYFPKMCKLKQNKKMSCKTNTKSVITTKYPVFSLTLSHTHTSSSHLFPRAPLKPFLNKNNEKKKIVIAPTRMNVLLWWLHCLFGCLVIRHIINMYEEQWTTTIKSMFSHSFPT